MNGVISLQKLYKLNWDESKATGYQLDHEYLPLLNAKRARDSVSDVSILQCPLVSQLFTKLITLLQL